MPMSLHLVWKKTSTFMNILPKGMHTPMSIMTGMSITTTNLRVRSSKMISGIIIMMKMNMFTKDLKNTDITMIIHMSIITIIPT